MKKKKKVELFSAEGATCSLRKVHQSSVHIQNLDTSPFSSFLASMRQ